MKACLESSTVFPEILDDIGLLLGHERCRLRDDDDPDDPKSKDFHASAPVWLDNARLTSD